MTCALNVYTLALQLNITLMENIILHEIKPTGERTYHCYLLGNTAFEFAYTYQGETFPLWFAGRMIGYTITIK